MAHFSEQSLKMIFYQTRENSVWTPIFCQLFVDFTTKQENKLHNESVFITLRFPLNKTFDEKKYFLSQKRRSKALQVPNKFVFTLQTFSKEFLNKS